ncbi:MAG: hypothetical protein ACK2T2_01540 [Anaerolineales bacterium]
MRATLREELQTATYPIELLLTENAGPLTEKQRQALETTQAALLRLAEHTKAVPPFVPTSK